MFGRFPYNKFAAGLTVLDDQPLALGTDSDAIWRYDTTNQWAELVMGSAEYRFRGAFSQAGAASALVLNHMVPGAATLSGSTGTTSLSTWFWANTAAVNTSSAITDLYYMDLPIPTASGTVTNAWSLYARGGVKFGSTILPAAHTQASAASDLNVNKVVPGALTLSGSTTTTSVALNRFANTAVTNASATISDLYNGVFEAPTGSGTVTRAWALYCVGKAKFADDVVIAATQPLYIDGGGDTYIVEGTGDRMDLVVGGSARLQLSTTAITAVERFRQIAGTVALPPYSFTSDTDSGVYSIGANDVGVSAGGVLAQEWLHDGTYVQTKFAGLLNSGSMNIKVIEESITIAEGAGAAGQATVGNLAPAGALILGVTCRVTQAPGGGATTFDLGVTAGDLDGFADNVSTALNTTSSSLVDGNATAVVPLRNTAATTLTLTTNSNVTGASMIVKITVRYIDLTAATA